MSLRPFQSEQFMAGKNLLCKLILETYWIILNRKINIGIRI